MLGIPTKGPRSYPSPTRSSCSPATTAGSPSRAVVPSAPSRRRSHACVNGGSNPRCTRIRLTWSRHSIADTASPDRTTGPGRPALPRARLPNTLHQRLLEQIRKAVRSAIDSPAAFARRRVADTRTRDRHDGRGTTSWRPICLDGFGAGDRGGEPPLAGLASELEDPTRHRDGDPVVGELFHEWVDPFPGRFACDRYAAARRNTSFSCSSRRLRRRSSRSSADSPVERPGLSPASMSVCRIHFDNVIG